MLYPERLSGRLARLVLDILIVLWTGAWALAGWEIYRLVMTLEVLADSITSTGRTFDSWIQDFRNVAPRGIPGLSGALSDLAGSLQRSAGGTLVRDGMAAHDRIQQVAIVLGLAIGAVPILVGTGSYVLWRTREVREMTAAAAFVRSAERTGRVEQARAVLAHRAVATLPFGQLMRASQDPIGDLEEGRYEALAAAMLWRAGLRPVPPGDTAQPRPRRVPPHPPD
jgi:hypothetical protein